MTDEARTVVALLVTGTVLIAGAATIVHGALPARRRSTRGSSSRRVLDQSRAPMPVAGAAAGLLESIPTLEPVRSRRRARGAQRLVFAISVAATAIALVLFGLGRVLAAWIDSISP